MGASKYFFSMSGVILLIGALSIGGKGLNLGIDFTSGTRITAGLSQPASEAQLRSVLSASGAPDAQVQRVAGDKALGKNGFQISAKQLEPAKVQQVRSVLESRYGVTAFNSTSVGPTFGKTVANSAVIAIIASLFVISALHSPAVRVEVRHAGADRPDARSADHGRRVLADGPGGDDLDRGRVADHPGLFALRHDHRVRPRAREHAPHAAGGVLADRQPLDVRGADPVAGHHELHD